MYLVEYNGDIERGRPVWEGQDYVFKRWIAQNGVFNTLDETLDAIAQDFPLVNDDGVPVRQTPDPEDDRIVVWELETGKKKTPVVAFVGWHWSMTDLPGAIDMTLPGDEMTLYDIAMEDL